MFRLQMTAALRAVLVFTVLVGVIYPLAVTAVAQLAFDEKADGSLVERDGVVVGSRLLGQNFEGEQWFHPRPSAAGDGYDGMSSSASNLGPTNPDLLASVDERAAAYRADNDVPQGVDVPIDAVTASASGLDPHISVANARLQAGRVAAANGLSLEQVDQLIDDHTDASIAGFLGEDAVNVLLLNLAVDDAA